MLNMETTPIIGSAVGIQYQGITDRSGSASAAGLTNGLIVGDFSRGRVDQPMLITKDTLEQLGDTTKLAYQTVVECLDMGVPAVWVMRVGLLPVMFRSWVWHGLDITWDDGQLMELPS